MIVLATDFGLQGPYTGQMKAVIAAGAPDVPVIDLFSDLPMGNPRLSAYLLAAYTTNFPTGSIFICVVDPGLGSSRRALCARVGGNWFIGPDNGLFEIIFRRSCGLHKIYEIMWRPKTLSASFHGRDIFAPIAVRLTAGESIFDNVDFNPIAYETVCKENWPDDLGEIIYIDHFGNAVTGLRSSTFLPSGGLKWGNHTAPVGLTFSSVSPGEVFCYRNSNNLMEIAVNQGRASDKLGIRIGDVITPLKV